MICNRCIRAGLRYNQEATFAARQFSQLPRRNLSSSSTRSSSATISQTAASPSSSHSSPPAATSTSAAQPFSAGLTPAPKPASASPVAVRSSCAAGTVLKGLNYTKGKQDPVALEDAEYPSWLWGILGEGEAKAGAGASAAEGDLFSKSKKQRRIAAKALRRQQLMNPDAMAPKVPLHEQTVDLPAGDGTVEGAIDAAGARESLTKSLRRNRRSGIKEANFLKAMG